MREIGVESTEEARRSGPSSFSQAIRIIGTRGLVDDAVDLMQSGSTQGGLVQPDRPPGIGHHIHGVPGDSLRPLLHELAVHQETYPATRPLDSVIVELDRGIEEKCASHVVRLLSGNPGSEKDLSGSVVQDLDIDLVVAAPNELVQEERGDRSGRVRCAQTDPSTSRNCTREADRTSAPS